MTQQTRLRGLEDTLIILKAVQPDAIKAMRNEIKSVITDAGVMSAIRARTPSVAPLSGMEHDGPTRWGGVRSLTTQVFSKLSGFDSKTVPLITIVASGGSDSLGFDYAELAGIRRRPPRSRSKIRGTGLRGTRKGDGSIAQNGQGNRFIEMIEERFGKTPGRFAYRSVMSKRRSIIENSQGVLDRYAETVNRKLR